MQYVAVLSSTGKKLMPTTARRARKLLKSGKAIKHGYRPMFTIQLTDRSDGNTQPIEFKMDTGYVHIGVSISSRKHEYVNAQYDMLKDKSEHHKDQRKYRRTRRNRKTRYRKPRWNNRKGLIAKDGFAPSIRNKRDNHIRLFNQYSKVLLLADAVFEVGQFDTQVLKAIEEGKPIPQGEDYQHGEQYGYATLREAVFNRDDYKCICCGKSAIKDGIILRIHHVGYWHGDRTNRMANLGSVCTGCHTTKSHQANGKLYGLKPINKGFKGATFMTMVRWDIIDKIKKSAEGSAIRIHFTYGAMTKLKRKELGVKKTHSNDAYAMGDFHPKHRTDFMHYQKCRRNNRILSKFYDAKYTDTRDGKVKSGKDLSCGRTNRSESRHGDKNERIYRGRKVKKGKIVIRTKHLDLRPYDKVFCLDTKCIDYVKGARSNGNILLTSGRNLSIKKIVLINHTGAWAKLA